jgi:hypothetical protein
MEFDATCPYADAMSGSVQHDINADGIIWKDNQAVVGFLQDAGV